MYERIKRIGRFARGLISPFYRFDCYYEKFSDEWRDLHRGSFEGFEVDNRIYHNRTGINDCSLVNWVFNLGEV